MMIRPRIYLSSPHIGTEELSLVQEAFASNWIAPLGPHVDAFEREFGEYVGSKAAAALSSGTAGLHLALRILGLRSSDDVFCSSFTFSASANPILYEKATPVFIDSEKDSWNMDPNLLADALKQADKAKRLPKAVILVHLYGQCANLAPIASLCEKYEVPLIEDAAEALGAQYLDQSSNLSPPMANGGVTPGTLGVFGIYSFNGNKIITTSGGGMLVSPRADLVEKARFLATQARDPAAHYQHSEIGYNYRLSNVLAAIGRGQLKVLRERVEARRANFQFYKNAFCDLPGINFMPEAKWSRSTRWLTCITIDPKTFGSNKEFVRIALSEQNIEARPVWKPLHLQPIFASYKFYDNGVAEDLFAHGLCLPSGSNLTLDDLSRVAAVVRGCCSK